MRDKLRIIGISFLASIMFVLLIPIINITCWEGCVLSYTNSIYAIMTSEMAFISVIFGILINLLIVFVLFSIFLFIIEKVNLNIFKKIILSIAFLLVIASIHYTIFHFFTDEGIEIRESIKQKKIFNKHLDIVLNEMKELKTKPAVEKYIKTQKEFTNTVCENTKVSRIENIEVFDKNIDFEKEYESKKLNIDYGYSKISKIISDEIFKPHYIPRTEFNKESMIENITKAYDRIGRLENRQYKINRSILTLEQYNFSKVSTQSQKEAHVMVQDLIDKLARVNHEENIKFDLRSVGLNDKSYYCNIKKQLTARFLGSYQPSKELTEEYHDCIFYVNNNLKTLVCFENDTTKYIFVNVQAVQHNGYQRFYDSFSKDGITIEKNTKLPYKNY